MKSYFTFFLVICASLAWSQSAIQVGRAYDVIDAGEKYYFAQGDEILALKIKKGTVILQKFKSGNLTHHKTTVYDDFEKNFVTESIQEFNGRYYLFYSLWNDENEQLFAREINFREGTFFTKGVKILSVSQRIAGISLMTGFYRFATLGKFNFAMAGDSSAMLVWYRLRPEVKRDAKNNDVIGMAVYDRTMKELWKKDVTMPYTEKRMDNLDYAVDRNGNAYVAARVFADESSQKSAPLDYIIEILKVSATDQALTKHQVALPDKNLRTLRIYETPKGDLLAAGVYNRSKDRATADGIFIFHISRDLKVTKSGMFPVPLDILNQSVSAKQQRKNERREDDDEAELENILLRDIHIEKDGSMLLTAEQHFILTHYHARANGGGSTSTTYHYNDILIAKITPEGTLGWMKKIPKRQVGGRNPGGMSFRSLIGTDGYYIVFLDNFKNLELGFDKMPARHLDGQGGFLALCKVDAMTGSMTKSMVLDTRDVQGIEVFQFSLNRIAVTGSHEFVFEAYKKKKEDVLVKVRL